MRRIGIVLALLASTVPGDARAAGHTYERALADEPRRRLTRESLG